MYIYPDNLKSKATLWLWELRDIGIVGIGCLISVFALAQLGFILPIVFTAAYAFLSIRIEDTVGWSWQHPAPKYLSAMRRIKSSSDKKKNRPSEGLDL